MVKKEEEGVGFDEQSKLELRGSVRSEVSRSVHESVHG